MALVALSVILIFLGIVCGAALVAAALGWAAVTGAALWVLFPLLVIGGFTLLAMGASHAAVRQVSRPAALALLALALLAAVALVAGAIGLAPRDAAGASAWPMWYVLIVAGGIGVTGAAAFRGRAAPAHED